MATARRAKNHAVNLLLLLSSIGLALVMAEGVSRKLGDSTIFVKGIWHGFDELLHRFVSDPHLGYRPDPKFLHQFGGRYGYQNGLEYEGASAASVTNIAFLGDSLVQYRYAENIVPKLLDPNKYRVWNIGVSGYNTLQESRYFQYQIEKLPDHLVLVYCFNDSRGSMSIRPWGDKEEQKFTRTEFEPLAYVFPELFRVSSLYRRLVHSYIKFTGSGGRSPLDIDRNLVQLGLLELKDSTRRNNISFTVLIFPYNIKLEQDLWSRENYQLIKSLVAELDIKHVDMVPDFLSRDMNLLFRENDVVHPNALGHYLGYKKLFLSHPEQFGLSPREITRVEKAMAQNLSEVLTH